ncbi:MAG: hypothetical protein R3Y32_06975 [Bacillota bacterium]
MSCKKELNGLIKAFEKSKIKVNSKANKCVGFGINTGGRYFLSLSGVKGDYIGNTFPAWKYNHSSNFALVQKELVSFFNKAGRRRVVVAHLTDKCETDYSAWRSNCKIIRCDMVDFNYQYPNSAEISRLFSCVERKILSGSTPCRIRKIYVSKEPCMLCKGFLKKVDIINK